MSSLNLGPVFSLCTTYWIAHIVLKSQKESLTYQKSQNQLKCPETDANALRPERRVEYKNLLSIRALDQEFILTL